MNNYETLADFLVQEPGEAEAEYAKFKASPKEYLDQLGLSIGVEEAHEEFKEFIEEGKQFWREEEMKGPIYDGSSIKIEECINEQL